ncbi:histidine phosphatase family protein [Nocardia blacklockiae]|nr:histidine phosphatase family protein [Nocardia blacklockiae]
MDLVLVRHARSVRAKTGIWGRLFDAPLDEGFEHQLSEARSALASLSEAAVFSSPLLRCRETADFVCPLAEIEVVDEFRAYHSGVFEDKPESFVHEHSPGYMELSYRERFLRPKFGEESVASQASRVRGGIRKVLQKGAPVSVIVAHYSTINIIAHVGSLNWDEDTYADGVYDLAEGAFIRMAIDPAAVAIGLQSKPGRGTPDYFSGQT